MIENTIRAALVTVIKSKRRKVSRAQRRRGIKLQRWIYPHATEVRYAALIRAWLRPMKDYVHKYLKENQEAILRGDSIDFTVGNADSIPASRLDAVPGKHFKRMIDSLNGWMGQYVPDDDENKSGSPIYMGLGNIANSVFDFNESQYEKGAKSVLGVEFPVGEDWWPDARDMWAARNYDLIHSDMQKYISQVNDLTEKAVTSGWSVSQLKKQIQGLDNKITKSKANFIARDQIGKLNGEITQRRMETVGLTMYIWETSGDERVRGDPGGKYPDAKPSHYLMDGLLCRWDDSTVYSQDGGKTWIPRPSGAVLLHPGMDYQCRCTAIAYWQELVGEVDEMIAQYEGLDALSSQNISAKPKENPPTPAPQPKRDYKPVDKKEFKEWEKDADSLFEKLTANQERALKMYSASGFDSMNRIQYDAEYAKSLSKAKLSEIKKINRDVTEAIDKGLVKSDIVVFRGENANITASWKPGEIHKREGFLSTSLSKGKAFITKDSVSLEIRVPADTRAAYIGHQSIPGNERELLLQTGSSFRVIERKGNRLVLELVL